MKKLLLISIIISFLPFLGTAQEEKQYYQLHGLVTAEADGQPLIGATVMIKGTTIGSVTDKEGRFELELPEGQTILSITYIGFTGQELTVSLPLKRPLTIALKEDIFSLGEVQVVSTGYQQLPKERATGSFVQLDNELLNRSVGTNILDRLEDVTPGMLFSHSGALYETNTITIRGRSTLFANEDPLIIVDRFPYDGDLNSINPNDVESVTILKDAAAASIWGARAGNGVIVITTKKGTYTQGPQVSFNSSFSVRERPDPFYAPQMSVSDYIALERDLFESGFYTPYEGARDKRALNPVTELLIAQREGELTAEETEKQIAALEKQDVRRDFEDYFYRESLKQQYALSISGGNDHHRYFLSAGYDHNQLARTGDRSQRFTLNGKNTWSFFENKLQLTGGVYYSRMNEQNNGINPRTISISNYNSLPPYVTLTDGNGNPVVITQDYRPSFLDAAEAEGLLNWRYNPIKEIELIDRDSRLTDYRLNMGLSYRLFPGMEATVQYQYWNSIYSGRDHYPLESYYARDLINRYTQVDDDGNLSHAIPEGGILDSEGRQTSSYNARAQLDYARKWNEMHEINAMAGFEIKELVTEGENHRFYGYDGSHATSAPVDYTIRFSQYYYPARSSTIPYEDRHASLIDRFVSFYANAAYTYDSRYILSVSGRKDQSNLFGVDANQRGIPLWSAGFGWNLSSESFYNWDWMPYLKLRATHGYSGNIDKSVTAYTTARMMGTSYLNGLQYAVITNPPNPDLRWERIKAQNFGLDFASRDNRLHGSIEYFIKQGQDLIGDMPVSATTGQSTFRGNVASTKGKGIDIAVTSRNIDSGLKWDTHWLFSRATTEVTKYEEPPSISALLEFGDRAVFPIAGRTLYGLYSYAWAGLNPETGAPRGYLDGEVSEAYDEIINGATVDSLVFHGPARPTTFGAVRNTFFWKNFSLSVNISYRLGHYFRRSSIVYSNTRGLGGHSDYALRWKEPGDEVFTEVPSIPENPDRQRDELYTYSEALVEKADHVRLQDINLTYTMDKTKWQRLPFQEVQLYIYARNLGILWKATDAVPDPTYRINKALASYAMGVRINF